MGLVGDFSENDLFVYFRWLIQDFSRSASLFLLPQIFPDTLYHDGSDGESIRSVASLQLENLKRVGRNMQPHFGRNAKSHDFHGFRPSPDRVKPDFSSSAAPARNVQRLSGSPLTLESVY